MAIFNTNNNKVESDELCAYLVKNGITDAKLVSLATVEVQLGKHEEMSFNKLNTIIKLVQNANDELKQLYDCGCFNIELDFVNSKITITETAYE